MHVARGKMITAAKELPNTLARIIQMILLSCMELKLRTTEIARNRRCSSVLVATIIVTIDSS